MRVTIDIPEGYEAKIVPSEKNDAVLLEFKTDRGAYVANELLATTQKYLGQMGWANFLMHNNPCTEGNGMNYVITASPAP